MLDLDQDDGDSSLSVHDPEVEKLMRVYEGDIRAEISGVDDSVYCELHY